MNNIKNDKKVVKLKKFSKKKEKYEIIIKC